MALTPRHLSSRLSDALANSRIVNVVGPRQDGKSILVRDLLKSAAYVTPDDDAARQSLEEDPYSQRKAHCGPDLSVRRARISDAFENIANAVRASVSFCAKTLGRF
ncbi:hypothetical protein RFN28_26735 [Mesorhizobium sp. VK24D]|uniref:AAA domain-containing protein n=1 Tax=Mesorhizobium album TaxID=3072314 RepID=A0ABU4Y5L7_9HYPH|nr:hypothetical protein [Mesorhizobium sp. VK24D]MDX8482031.1 hypothetical protein [Mesorhizobium sp. VK24D]